MRYKTVKPPQPKSPEKALNSLMSLCARAERCSGDARRLMERWQVDPAAREGVLAKLIGMRFIDDSRFTELFIREKSNLSGWGERRITMELTRRGVEREIIEEKIAEIDKHQQFERLTELLKRRLRSTRGKNSYEIKSKLLRYGATLGYDYSTMSRAIEQLEINCDTECDDIFF